MSENNSLKQIMKKLIAFSIPLILSGVFQQLFNWVDALIVGNMIGETALAGVGATSSFYNLFVTIIVSFTSGLSILFAQQFGKKEYKENAKLLSVYSILLGSISFVIVILGIIFIVPILKMMDMPTALFNYARDYLMIIFIGIPFLAIYNTYSSALRGMGNSAVPFIAVLISSVINIALDYIFIAHLEYGVAGAAVATVISQTAMTIYIVLYTIIKYPQLRYLPFKAREHWKIIKTGGKFGLPPAVQGSISSIGNLFLQRFMNGFGEQTVAAITTAYRVDSMLFLPIINFSTAISTLVAQETGAGNEKATVKIFKLGTIIMSVISILLTVLIMALGKSLLSVFGLSSESVAIGKNFFRSISVFYIIYGLSMSIKGYLEGISDMLFSGIVGICSLIVRILCSYLFKDVFENMVVAYAEVFSWVFLLALFILRYLIKRKHKV